MRVAIDGMLLGGRASGVEASIGNLATALAARGLHDYCLYTQAAFEGMRVVSTRWPVRWRPVRIVWQQAAFPALLARGSVDVVHAPGYVAPVLSPVPVVVTVYDALAFTHPELCTRANRWHYRLMMPLSLRRARRIVVPSETTRRDVLRLVPGAAERVRVIPLGIEERFGVVPAEAERAQLKAKLGVEGPYILFVGGLEPKKNVAGLIEAFRLLGQRVTLPHRLVIAGARSWDGPRIERALRASGLAGRVVRTGYVPPERLPALYRAADLFVFPSLYEGFGLPPLEAMACGVPTVVSGGGALAEVAGPAARVVDPATPGNLAEAMEAVLTQRHLRADLVARGLRHAALFRWDRTAQAMERVYAEAAGEVCS